MIEDSIQWLFNVIHYMVDDTTVPAWFWGTIYKKSWDKLKNLGY